MSFYGMLHLILIYGIRVLEEAFWLGDAKKRQFSGGHKARPLFYACPLFLLLDEIDDGGQVVGVSIEKDAA